MDWKPGAHASTFGGNPVSIAAALVTTIDLIERNYMANAVAHGRIHHSPHRGLARNGTRSSATSAGKGLMIGMEFVRDQDTKEKAPDLRNRIVQMAFQKGLLVLGAGENCIRLAPPLMIEEEQVEFAISTLDACISTVEGKGSRG